jgi:hypothetical protein
MERKNKMDKIEIEKLLIERSKIAAERAQFAQGYDEMRSKIIPPEVKAELDALETESKTALSGVDAKLALLDEQIKAGVLGMAETVTVKGVGQAVFNKGRVTWETKALDGLLVAIPELAKFRKEGDPYVTIKGG